MLGFFVLSELEGPAWACTSLITLMDVDVSCVLFWTQPACMVQNQNTRNIYLQADDKQCSYAPKNTIPCLSRLRAERLAEKSEILVDPMTKHFAFSRWEAGLSPSLPRAQEEGGSDTHSLTVLRPRCYLALTTMLFPSFVHGQRQR